MRAQLATQGITGVKFIDIDFFVAAPGPSPALPFEPAAKYLRTRPSLLKGLADQLEAVGDRLPAFVDHADRVIAEVERVLGDVHDERVVARIGTAADAATAALVDLRRASRELGNAKLGDRAALALDHVRDTLSHLDELAAQLDGARGLVTSARRATDAFGDLGGAALGSSEELQHTLRELADAARAFRELVEAVDREPDMLVKGRARTGRP
jgi:paraquat-inducible protein B